MGQLYNLGKPVNPGKEFILHQFNLVTWIMQTVLGSKSLYCISHKFHVFWQNYVMVEKLLT